MADPESTHHAECWRNHPACAVARVEALEAEVTRLRAAILATQGRYRKWSGNVDRLDEEPAP